MDFSLTLEQEAVRDSARRFAKKEILPFASEWDEKGEFPLELIKKAHQAGLLNIIQPAEYGGVGLSKFEAALVIEELASACAGVTTSLVANDLALLPISLFGTKEQKERFLKPIAEAGLLASFCLTEPQAGSDAAGIVTEVKKDGDSYIISGQKQWITNGGLASQYTVFATLDKTKRHKGICCLVVPANTKGVSHGKHENKLGQRASNTAAVFFNEVRVPKENLIGKEGEGFKVAMTTLDHSRPLTAAIAVGIAKAAFEYSKAWALERKQFGQPIANFQAIQFMLADMYTNLTAARLLTLTATRKLDKGEKAALESTMAKRFSADIAMEAATNAVQIYGGYGYSKEYPVEKIFRDAKLLQIYEGTSQIQRIVIARELLKEE
ncbi:MAG: acyl-CoA dehydrogenase [Candidatus Dadabacteria bacterium]|nr:MAG: acyl-CoA dehydrogenase [Candidatus Dadabacteria bacterium]